MAPIPAGNYSVSLPTAASGQIGPVVNLNGIQPTGSFGDPIDALFGGMAGLFGDGTAQAENSIVPGFNVGPLLTVAVLGAIVVVVVRALRKG